MQRYPSVQKKERKKEAASGGSCRCFCSMRLPPFFKSSAPLPFKTYPEAYPGVRQDLQLARSKLHAGKSIFCQPANCTTAPLFFLLPAPRRWLTSSCLGGGQLLGLSLNHFLLARVQAPHSHFFFFSWRPAGKTGAIHHLSATRSVLCGAYLLLPHTADFPR